MIDTIKTVEIVSDAYYFHQGKATRAYEYLGAHRIAEKNGKFYYAFRIFASRAARVETVGDFNPGGSLSMNKITADGLFETIFESDIPLEGMKYKFRVFSDAGVFLRSDPYAHRIDEEDPIVCEDRSFIWHDQKYLADRRRIFQNKTYYCPIPINICLFNKIIRYDKKCCSYAELAERISSYLIENGYTHALFCDIKASYFAPSSAAGSPDDFRTLVDILHSNGLGIMVDFNAAFFGCDDILAKFDGHGMYEADTVPCGKALYFDLERPEVTSFLISSALYWFREFHIDGILFENTDELLSSRYSGFHSIEFIKNFNSTIFSEFPDVIVMSDSKANAPGITKPVISGGLGFNFRFDTKKTERLIGYAEKDPVTRETEKSILSDEALLSSYENDVLFLSLDRSTLDRIHGCPEDKAAMVRTLLASLMTQPGKKAMGAFCDSFGNEEQDSGFARFRSALDHFYSSRPELWEMDFVWDGFCRIIVGGNCGMSAYKRFSTKGEELICVMNYSPVMRNCCRLFVGGNDNFYRTVFSSDDQAFGGQGRGSNGILRSCNGVLEINVPPLSAFIFEPVAES